MFLGKLWVTQLISTINTFEIEKVSCHISMTTDERIQIQKNILNTKAAMLRDFQKMKKIVQNSRILLEKRLLIQVRSEESAKKWCLEFPY